MWKTKRTVMTLALGMVLVLVSTAFAAAPVQASTSRTASSLTSSQQVQAVWGGWGEVPGNGFTLSGPATQGGVVFVRGTNNRIYMNTFNGTTWSGWSEVPGNGLTPSAPAATTSTSGAEPHINLFVRGTDNKIYINTFIRARWSGWSQVPGNGSTIDSPGALGDYVFVRGTNDRIYMNTLNEGGWSGWSEVPGHGLTLSGPTTSYSSTFAGPFILNLFVRGTNNHLYVNRMSGGTTWSGWSEVPGHGLTPSAPAATTLFLNVWNTLYLFVRGTDNKIYVNTFVNETVWSGWSEVSGHGLTPDAPGATDVETSMSGDQGLVYLFVRGTNDRIYMNILRVTR